MYILLLALFFDSEYLNEKNSIIDWVIKKKTANNKVTNQSLEHKPISLVLWSDKVILEGGCWYRVQTIVFEVSHPFIVIGLGSRTYVL